MKVDWKSEIARMVYWKQVAAGYDVLGALPWHLPNVAASLYDVLSAERVLGTPFPSEYREFLGYADGWRGFEITTDLFGTRDFLTGRATKLLTRPELDNFISTLGIDREYIIPIGCSEFDLDVFLAIGDRSPVLPGGVIWFANEEVDRFNSFSEFFSTMINYAAHGAQKLAENARAK